MTNADYIRAYRKAHSLSGRITADTMRVLKDVYIEAGKLAAAQVKAVEAAGLSDLTSGAWKTIESELAKGADMIVNTAADAIPQSVTNAYSNFLDTDIEYITDAIDAANVTLITEAGLRNLGIGVNHRLLQAQASRVLDDGYTFSERVWLVGKDYELRIKNLILLGEAQGRDTVSIANDIQLYIEKGKNYVLKESRFGKLKPGTAEYKARIPKKIDWRALRLVRSEVNASLQEAQAITGLINPASVGLYDWIKTPGNPLDQKGPRCIDLAEAGPYKYDEIPSYPHPNCSCYVRPVLRDHKDFIDELKSWSPGDGSSIDNWYQSVYLTNQ